VFLDDNEKMTRKQEICLLIRDAIRSFLPQDEVGIILFGSQAGTVELKRSDFDVGLISSAPIPPVILTEIRFALEELPMLYPVDLVELSNAPPAFQKYALAHSQTI